MSSGFWPRLQSRLDHFLDSVIAYFAGHSWSWFIKKGVNSTILNEPITPKSNRSMSRSEISSHGAIAQARGAFENDLGPKDHGPVPRFSAQVTQILKLAVRYL